MTKKKRGPIEDYHYKDLGGEVWVSGRSAGRTTAPAAKAKPMILHDYCETCDERIAWRVGYPTKESEVQKAPLRRARFRYCARCTARAFAAARPIRVYRPDHRGCKVPACI